jgi:hypothetical protein
MEAPVGAERDGWVWALLGRSRSPFAVRDRLHEEFRVVRNELRQVRRRAESLSDDAWARVDRQYHALDARRQKAIAEMTEGLRVRKRVLGAELAGAKAQMRSRVARALRSFWTYVVFYALWALFVCPVLYAVYLVAVERPQFVLYAGAYVIVLALFLLWSLAVPSLSHRGVSLWTPYELSPLEQKQVDAYIARAAERVAHLPAQRLWGEAEREQRTLVLSLDGGGIKGTVSARILARICDEFPELMSQVSLIAGCSTGSILGGMLATGFTPSEVGDMFAAASPLVFRATVWDSVVSLGGLRAPQHRSDGKLKILEAAYRGLRLRDLPVGVCFLASHVSEGSSFNHCAPRVWSNVVAHGQHAFVGHHGPDAVTNAADEHAELQREHEQEEESEAVLDMRLADVVSGSTAAPLYFNAHQGHVDGGLWGNNPASAALAHILPAKDLKSVVMLSISTGLHVPEQTMQPRSGLSWGLKQWLPWVIDWIFNSTSQANHFTAMAMLGERYHRIEPILPRPIMLNDVSAIDELNEAADAVDLDKTFRFLEKMGFARRQVAAEPAQRASASHPVVDEPENAERIQDQCDVQDKDKKDK